MLWPLHLAGLQTPGGGRGRASPGYFNLCFFYRLQVAAKFMPVSSLIVGE